MADSGAVRAGKAFVEIGGDAGPLDKVLASVQKKMYKMGENLTKVGKVLLAAGSAIYAPLVLAAKSAADAGSALYDLSKRTGMSVEALSALGYAAEQTGSSLDVVEGAIKKMQMSIAGVADSVEGTTGSVAFLGVSLKGMTANQQFHTIAEAIGKIQDPTKRAAAAIQVFGRSGTQLLPMIEELAALEKRAKQLGLVKTTGFAKEADALGDALTDLKLVTKSAWEAIGEILFPIVRDAAERMVKWIIVVRDWIKEHKGVVVIAYKVALSLIAAGAGFIALGQGLKYAATAISVARTGLQAVFGIISVFINPIGALVLALAGLGAYWLVMSGNGAKALNWLGERFQEFKEIAIEAWGGIADALSAGDLALAGQIAWAALKLVWDNGVASLRPLIEKVKAWLGEVADVGKVIGERIAAGVNMAIVKLKELLAWTMSVAKSALYMFNALKSPTSFYTQKVLQSSQKNIESEVARIQQLRAKGNPATKTAQDTMRATLGSSTVGTEGRSLAEYLKLSAEEVAALVSGSEDAVENFKNAVLGSGRSVLLGPQIGNVADAAERIRKAQSENPELKSHMDSLRKYLTDKTFGVDGKSLKEALGLTTEEVEQIVNAQGSHSGLGALREKILNYGQANLGVPDFSPVTPPEAPAGPPIENTVSDAIKNGIGSAMDWLKGAMTPQTDAESKAAQANIDALKKELADLRAKAADAKKRSMETTPPAADEAKANAEAVDMKAAKSSSSGTFNAFAIASLIEGKDKELLKETKNQGKVLQKIADNTGRGMAFA